MRWTLFAFNSYIKNMWFNGMFLLFEVITTIFGVKMTIFWFKAGLSILGLSWIYLLPLFAPHFWHLHLFDNKLFVSLAAWSSFALEMNQMHHVRKKCAASLLPWFQYFQLLLLSEWWASQRARGRCAQGSWSLHIHTWQTVRGTNRKQQSTEEPMRRCKTRYIPGFVACRQIIIQLIRAVNFSVHLKSWSTILKWPGNVFISTCRCRRQISRVTFHRDQEYLHIEATEMNWRRLWLWQTEVTSSWLLTSTLTQANFFVLVLNCAYSKATSWQSLVSLQHAEITSFSDG